ncbi:hypothetical protein DAMA08_029920 [Martiniozyma asiatica (nom. inval.)]|nr:hypothetical protein DAMA08_029920 [Martiniozyma asiatica]
MTTIKALTYLGPGKISWQDVPMPTLVNDTDVIGKVLATTICGTDLHIIKGDVPETTAIAQASHSKGIILGHEAIIEVTECGDKVKNFKSGDVCIVSCITSCGDCYYCKRNIQAHCSGNEGSSGWIFGHEIDGSQAEYMRVPFADNGLFKAPDGIPFESLLMLSDAMPTSFEIGVINGEVKKGDVVAIVGLGPVGLGALLTASIREPEKIIAIDTDDSRLALAKQLGATHTFNPSTDNVVTCVNELTTTDFKEKGVDVAIECVGIPSTFELCQDLICPGGRIANVGVHGKPVQLKLQELWIKNIKISTGLVSAYSTKELLDSISSGKINPSSMVSHKMKMSDFEEAYGIFKNAAGNKAIKMFLTP